MPARRILVVDDDAAITELMQAALEGEGFAVRVVNDPRDAVEACRAFRPSVVLLDMRMPYLSGPEVLVLLEREEAMEGVPVVAFTAGDDEAPRESRACVRKPFDFDDFLALLRRLLEPAWAV